MCVLWKAKALTKHSDVKAIFAPIPVRAMADERLSSLDLRVLMAVAAHDRLGKNGIGCFASNTRLASLVRCHLKSLSRSLSTLAKCGYLEGYDNPLNKRTRIHRILYTDDDAQLMKAITSRKGNEIVTNDPAIGNEIATENPPIGNKLAPNARRIGNHVSENAFSDQQDTHGNIFCEAEKKSSETDIINSGEPAPSPEKTLSDGERLARIERQFSSGDWNIHLLQSFTSIVKAILDRAEPSSMEYGWSERLLAAMDAELYPSHESMEDSVDEVPF
jgi:DNA-binding MarR family transcriptional regulator